MNKQALTYLVVGLLVVGLIIGASQSKKTKKAGTTAGSTKKVAAKPDGFLGEKGEVLVAKGENVEIDEKKVGNGNLHAFNFYSEKAGKTIYFFVVMASDGTYRVAANACELCFGSKLGFKQIGELIRCENCRTTYTKDQIAMEKGGCNPRPIDKDAKVVGGKLVVRILDIEASADLF